jgi:hypothetical protein
MSRRLVASVLGAVLVTLLGACTFGGSSGSSAPASAAGSSGSTRSAAGSAPDGSNNCKGQGVTANVAAHVKRSASGQWDDKPTLVRLKSPGDALTASALSVRAETLRVTWQVTARGSYVCDVQLTFSNGNRFPADPDPAGIITQQEVTELYVTAYDPAL